MGLTAMSGTAGLMVVAWADRPTWATSIKLLKFLEIHFSSVKCSI